VSQDSRPQNRVLAAKDQGSGKNLVIWGPGTQGDVFIESWNSVPALTAYAFSNLSKLYLAVLLKFTKASRTTFQPIAIFNIGAVHCLWPQYWGNVLPKVR